MKWTFFQKRKKNKTSRPAENRENGTEAAEQPYAGAEAPRQYPHDKPYLKSDREVPGVRRGFFARLGLDGDYLVGGLTQLFIALLSVGAVLYFGQYLYTTLSSGVSVTQIYSISETVTVEGTAFLIRDAQPLSAKDSGYLAYLAEDGARVAKGDTVAGLYASDVSDLQRQLRETEQEADLIARSLSGNGVLSAIDGVAQSYADLMQFSAAGNWNAYGKMADELREQMNRSASYRGGAVTLSDRLEALQQQKAVLNSSMGTPKTKIIAPVQGYYYHDCDGYETLITTDLLQGFTADTYRKLLQTQPLSAEGTAGVLVKNQKWYLAVECEGFALEDTPVGGQCRVIFPSDDNREISMQAESVIRTDTGVILLLYSSVLPADFSFDRIRTVKIVSAEKSGYRIPVSALHTEDGITGVYTLHGKNVIFRRIEVIGEGVGYCIVSPSDAHVTPKTYRRIAYVSDSAAASVRAMEDFAAARGAKRQKDGLADSLGAEQTLSNVLFMRRGSRGTPLAYGEESPYYAYLDGVESVIISGRDLYHGKVVD